MGLTKRTIDAQRWNPKGPPAQIVWDDELKGFGIRVFESGAKSFILNYRDENGVKRRITLGRYGAVTPDQGRKKAMKELSRISDGANPAAEKKGIAEAITMREYAPLYVDQARTVGNAGRKVRKPKKSWGEDQRRITKYILPAFGPRRLASITKPDVVRLHKKIGRTAPFEANRVLALVSVMFTAAIEDERLPAGFQNPAHGVTQLEEPSRDRFVTEDEMPVLWKAIQADPNPYVRALFTLSLLLGTRRSELLNLKWDSVDLTRGELRLLDTKAGNTHPLPLSKTALEILTALPRLLGNPFVFPSPVEPGQPMRDVKRQWARIRSDVAVELWTAANPDRAAALDRAGIEKSLEEDGADFDVRFHDLRRTVGSWLAISGVSLQQIGRVLNHADPSTTAVYARLTEASTRTNLDQHAQHLIAVAGGSTGA